MAVLIENMAMPIDCYECEFEHYGRCQLCSKAVQRITECLGRPGFCPLREVSQEDRWKPVSEGMPPLEEDVYVFAKGKIDGFIGETVKAITHRYIQRIFSNSEGVEVWHSPWAFFLTDYEITHWMPLPAPPKEDENEKQG